jgi:hypothetical protein
MTAIPLDFADSPKTPRIGLKAGPQQILPCATVAAAHDFLKGGTGEIHPLQTCRTDISGMTKR